MTNARIACSQTGPRSAPQAYRGDAPAGYPARDHGCNDRDKLQAPGILDVMVLDERVVLRRESDRAVDAPCTSQPRLQTLGSEPHGTPPPPSHCSYQLRP